MAKFKMGALVPAGATDTARLGSAADAGGRLANTEMGKFVKLAGDSQYDLVAVGDPIEGFIQAIDPATQDGWTIGSVTKSGRVEGCVCDGDEATPGTGTIAVGDVVVAGTVVAKGTALTAAAPAVCKATNQPGAVIDVGVTVDQTNVNAALLKITDAADVTVKGLWRVVSLGTAGAVGDTCTIERIQ